MRLRQLIRNYTRGLGILKEFVQNADDAGASRVRFEASTVALTRFFVSARSR